MKHLLFIKPVSLSLSCARCLWFRLRLAGRDGVSHSALRVCCRKKMLLFFMFCVFSFPPGVFVGTLNLIESIPGPSVLFYSLLSETL